MWVTSLFSLQWCHWLTITHCHCWQSDPQHIILKTSKCLVRREKLSSKFKTNTLNLTYPSGWREAAGLSHCPAPGGYHSTGAFQVIEEKSIKPLSFILIQKEEKKWQLDTIGLSLFPRQCCWATVSLTPWCLEKESLFSRTSLDLLETILTAFSLSYPKWLNLAEFL